MQEKTKILLAVIITFISTLSITVFAVFSTSAINITFSSDKTEKTNVGNSLDELYTMVYTPSLKPENIKSGVNLLGKTGTFTSDATADASKILSGQTAYVNGNKITGTMTNQNGAVAGGTPATYNTNYVKIPITSAGYYDTSDYIYVNDNNFGNATAADVLAGKTFTSDAGTKVTGTYQIPSLTVGYNLGSQASEMYQNQFRIQNSQYSSLYKYFKFRYSEADSLNRCTNIFFSSLVDVSSENLYANTTYNTSTYWFVVYITGSAGCFYNVAIEYFN